MLRGEIAKAPHSIYGAALAGRYSALDAAFAISGHHAGMPDRSVLKERVVGARLEAEQLWEVAVQDCPDLLACLAPDDPLLYALDLATPEEFDLQCRMLLSCLVDADRLDTAEHAGRSRPSPEPLDPANRLSRLLMHIERKAKDVEDGVVKRARAEVLADCLIGSERAGPLFSLTVPTGGGKTLASMAFALRRATLFPAIRRVIVVIPYLSIIEQNAAVYRDALGEGVLEHHSAALGGSPYNDDRYENPVRRAAAENWDSPVVVTTSVRFFETLFSNHPRDLRRLHNVAQSVVILDEAQTLPREYVAATLSVVSGLAQHWGVTFVFSTATQPALEAPEVTAPRDPRWAPGTLQEISSDVPGLFSALSRVTTSWRSDPIAWQDVAIELSSEPQVLAIVNTRKHARSLAEHCERAGRDVVHLSTNLCPAHRRQLLAFVRQETKAGRRCLVVATQLVEAGVDLDFPVVWRALGPLDSIAQAAGRCDREGRLTQTLGRPGGRLVVFVPDEPGMPTGVYQQAADITASLFRDGLTEWADPGLMRRYFDRLYGGGDHLDRMNVQEKRREAKFKTVADTVEWIKDSGLSVLVPYDDEAMRLMQLMRSSPGVSLEIFRSAQQFMVNLAPWEAAEAKRLGSIEEIREGVWICREGFYDQRWGISIDGHETVF